MRCKSIALSSLTAACALALGKGDTEILQWIQKNAKHKHGEPQILA
jgi:hypothetical protein